jgi:isopentenyl-diphosphate delta-isomerase
VAGAGGTSWSEVEYHRAPSDFHARVARSFADWGIPTADAIQYARSAAPELSIFASGGLRDGIDIAKCIALGADLAGLASPFLKAASQSAEAVHELICVLNAQLRVAMLCTASADLASLRRAQLEPVGFDR